MERCRIRDTGMIFGLLMGGFVAWWVMGVGAVIDSCTMERDVPGHYERGKVYGNTWPYLNAENWKKISSERPDSRWVFISGDKDYDYDFTKASAVQWRKYGFAARFFDVPGLGHQIAPAGWFEKALLWVEGGE